MSKLVFPAVGTPYRGFVGEVRGWFQRIASFQEKSSGSAAALLTQLSVLATALGGALTTVGANLSLRNYAGTAYAPARTVAMQADGTVRMPSTALPVISGTLLAIPAPTGSYVTGITLTIVNGAVTAAVLS